MSRRARLTLVIAVLAGCSSQSPSPSTPPTAVSQSVAPPPFDSSLGVQLVDLSDLSVSGLESVSASEPLVVSATELRFGNASPLVTLENRRIAPEHRHGGDAGYMVIPLQRTLEAAEDTSEITAGVATRSFELAPGTETHVRTLTEVLYTIGQASFRSVSFWVRVGGQIKTLRADFPTFGSTDEPGPVLELSPDGQRVQISFGERVTSVPTSSAPQLLSALRDAHGRAPDAAATVVAVESAPVSDFLRLIALARGSELEPFFSKVYLRAEGS